MAGNKKPRKRYSPGKGLLLKTRMSWSGEFQASTLRRLCTTNLTAAELYKLQELVADWEIEVTVDCGEYQESEVLIVRRATFHDLDTPLKESQRRVRDKVNESHILQTRWKMRPII